MRWPFSSALLLLALAHLSASKPLLQKRWDEFEVKHAWEDVPEGWELHSDAPAEHTFNMRIGLKQAHFDDLVTTLYEVSDPAHPKYGQHLSKEEVESLVAPHPETVSLVDSWLVAHGIDPASTHRENGGSSITVKVSVEQASRMLNASYGVYHHGKTSDRVVRSMSYSLPRILLDHINVVSPTTYFSTLRTMRSTNQPKAAVPIVEAISAILPQSRKDNGTVPDSCNTVVTPACLRALYNTASYKPQATKKNAIGIAGYLEEYANYEDLQTFYKQYLPEAVGTSFETVLVNGGGNNQSQPGFEANMDIQYTEGITFPTPNIYYSTGGRPPLAPGEDPNDNFNEPYLEWLQFILAQKSFPQVFTTSYADSEDSVPFDYAVEVCNLFAQLGARGSSFFFASGDSGVGGSNCTGSDGRVHFSVGFPASCPFVTAVGATVKVNPEVTADFSGGSFSNYFSRPHYQNEAVSHFLHKLGDTYKGFFNASGRAYPDVSAQGDGFQTIVGGVLVPDGGTSASTPTFAGVVALLNDHRLAHGKPPLGFLNPIIYSKGASGFNDITIGSNPGCGTQGFNATPGWDPATGLGTPDFAKLKHLIG